MPRTKKVVENENTQQAEVKEEKVTKAKKTTKVAKAKAPKKETKKVTKKESNKKLRVTLIRSAIACKPNQVKTVKALGLNKVNSHNDLVDNEAIRGMIFTVKHLVKVEEI